MLYQLWTAGMLNSFDPKIWCEIEWNLVRNWMKIWCEIELFYSQNLVRNWMKIWCEIEWVLVRECQVEGQALYLDINIGDRWDFLCVFVRLSPQSQCILGKKGAHPVQLFSWLPFYLLAQLESSQLSCCLHHNHRSNLKSRIAKSTGLNLDVAASLTIPLIIKVWFRIFFRFLAPILLSDKLLWIVS